MKAPLAGVEVVDVGTLTPGKYCTCILADLGASVLRVERPAEKTPPISAEDLALNRNKRSLTLNLREEAGLDVFRRLAERADVVIESYRPGVADRLGIGYAHLRERNPGLVYCSLSGFGQDGPNRLRPAYDLIFMAMSGVLQALVGEGRTPVVPRAYLADAVSGLMATIGISSALVARGRTGQGTHIDLAMLDGIFSVLSVSHGVARGSQPPGVDVEATAESALYTTYETSDSRRVALGAARPSSCQTLFQELGRPDLADRAWSSGGQDAEVAEFLRERFRTAPAEEWVGRLAPRDVEIAPVSSATEAFCDPQIVARQMAVETSHPAAGPIRQIGCPIRFAGEPAPALAPAPAVGQHTGEVLGALGYTSAEIADLRRRGIV